MRILIVHNFYQHHGGEDTVVQQEADELSKRGHEVKILTTQNSKGIKGILQYGLYPYNMIVAYRLLKQIETYKPQIIHIHNLHYGIGPLLIRKLKNRRYPLVMTLHNFRLICPSATLFAHGSLFTSSITENFPWTAVKEKVLDNSLLKTFITAYTYWAHRQAGTWNAIDQYFTFSDFSKSIFTASKLNIPAHKLTIKPNFVPVPQVSKATFADYFVYIGRLSVEKGIIPLLEGISQTNYTLKIYGTGPQEEEVKEFARSYPTIEYHGFQPKDKLAEVLAEANALIVPSVCYEGMPMNIIEAFSLGTPVLCSNIGILAQMVVPLQTGLHFEPASRHSITTCLEKWMSLDLQAKEKISTNCIDEYLNKYTAARNMVLVEDVYQHLIKENEHNNYRPS